MGAPLCLSTVSPPLRIAHAGAKRLGLSEWMLQGALSYLHSTRFMQRSFGRYEAAPHDVFAATYMKSGTNWSMQIALQTAWRGEAEFQHIHDLVPWPDSPDRGAVVPLDCQETWASAPSGLRVVMTHLRPQFVPWSPAARYITVLRDPKVVLVSAYYFVTALMGVTDTVSPQDFMRVYLAYGRRHGDPWLAHAQAWWRRRELDNVLVLEYTEMMRDLGQAVDRVAELMGVPLTPAERARVIERSSLPWMRANRDRFRPLESPFVDPDVPASIIRRGVSGGADELYSPAELARLDAALLDELAAQASDFPYRQLFSEYVAQAV